MCSYLPIVTDTIAFSPIQRKIQGNTQDEALPHDLAQFVLR